MITAIKVSEVLLQYICIHSLMFIFFRASILSKNFLDDRASKTFSFEEDGDVKGHNRASKSSRHVEIQ